MRDLIKYSVCRRVWSIALISLFFSCNDNKVDYGFDKYFVEIVTAQNENEFLSDNGQLIVATPRGVEKKYAFGDRVLLNYSLLTDESGKSSAQINGSAKIPLGKLTLTDGASIESSHKEPVILESVWLGSHYLNMQFYFNFKSKTHKIGLMADSTRMASDTIKLYFIHDTDNDPPGYSTHTYLHSI